MQPFSLTVDDTAAVAIANTAAVRSTEAAAHIATTLFL
jgi:hypothetical protein